MTIKEATVYEHHEGWVIMVRFDGDFKSLGIPCIDLETAIRILALCQCDKFVIKFLNGTSMDVDHNTLEVR